MKEKWFRKLRALSEKLVRGAAAIYEAGGRPIVGFTRRGRPVFPVAGGQDYGSQIERTDLGVLPEDVASEIIQNLPQTSAAMALFRKTRMSRKLRRMPVLASFPSAYWVDGDTGLKQFSKMQWKNKWLTAEELAVIVPIPEAVLDDEDFGIWGEVRPRIEEAIGIAIDAAVFFGTDKPASWPLDIVAGAVAAGNTVNFPAGADLAIDVSDVMTTVENDGFDVNGFAARRGMKGRFRNLRMSTGEPMYVPIAGTNPATLYGERVYFAGLGGWDDTKAELIAGDFDQGVIAVRQDITYKMLDQAVLQDDAGLIVYNLAQQDMVALRCVVRLAFQVANPLTRAAAATGWSPTGSSTTYPFGVLQP